MMKQEANSLSHFEKIFYNILLKIAICSFISLKAPKVKLELSKYKALLSWGFYKTRLQTGWLKITEIYSLTILEVGSLKSVSLGRNQDVIRAVFPPERIPSCFFSFRQPLTFFGLWPHNSNFEGQNLQISLCSIFTSHPPPCVKSPSEFPFLEIHVILLRAHLDNPGQSPHLKILKHICKDPLFST